MFSCQCHEWWQRVTNELCVTCRSLSSKKSKPVTKGPCRIAPKRICPECGARISTSNFSRHLIYHRGTDPQPASTGRKTICPKCGAKITTRNFSRHWRVHRTIDPQPASTLSVPVSVMSQQQTSTPSSSIEPPVEAGVMSLAAASAATSQSSSVDSLSTQYVKAARALLKRTDRYTEGNLMAFLAAKYPDIPEVNRQALVIGATTGAQTAAQLHVLVEGTKTCRDTASRVMAQGAQRYLAYWNLGLMSEDPDDPNPQIVLP